MTDYTSFNINNLSSKDTELSSEDTEIIKNKAIKIVNETESAYVSYDITLHDNYVYVVFPCHTFLIEKRYCTEFTHNMEKIQIWKSTEDLINYINIECYPIRSRCFLCGDECNPCSQAHSGCMKRYVGY